MIDNLLTSFLGSLLAGLVLLSTSPIWWKYAKTKEITELFRAAIAIVLLGVASFGLFVLGEWLVNLSISGTRYELIPPENMSNEEIEAIRLSCDLEAEQIYPEVDGPAAMYGRRERLANKQSYFQRCLQREGFSLGEIEPSENADPQ